MLNREMLPRPVDMIEANEHQFNNEVVENSLDIKSSKVIPLFNSDTLEKIQERFLHTAEKKELDVFFTKDKDLLNQYYSLRDRCFKEDSGWDEYDGSEVSADVKGRILIATNSERRVVGGMRILMPRSDGYSANDHIDDGLTIKNFLQKSGLNSEAEYSEISAVAVEKEFRNRVLMKEMFTIVIKESLAQKCDYVIGVGILVACRDYRIIFRSLGYKLDIGQNFTWTGRKTKNGYASRFPMVVHLKEQLSDIN